MPLGRRHWTDELAVIDRVMRSVSDISDPEDMVSAYWAGIKELLPIKNWLALSRRGVTAPDFLITRSSRFTEHPNPWLERDRLPRLRGGLLGEIAYADAPVVIDNLPQRLAKDDPAYFYLEGFAALVALPNYDQGAGLNVGITLYDSLDDFHPEWVPMMHWQASLFGRGTQNLVLKNQLTDAMSRLERELKIVGDIQRSLLPPAPPQIRGFEIATHYQTSAQAGGDYYDFFPFTDGAWGVLIADVSGHGTPAAVLMAVTHAIAHTRPGDPKPPREILAHLNHHLGRSYTGSGAFVTAFYAELDPATCTFTYAVAGHNPPRLVRDGRVLSVDGRGGPPLGVLPDGAFSDDTLRLLPGDVLVLYTDGITEAMAPPTQAGRRELFGTDRLDACLIAAADRPVDDIVRAVNDAVHDFTAGAPPGDDRTLVVLRCRG